jgi:hypothetical protein
MSLHDRGQPNTHTARASVAPDGDQNEQVEPHWVAAHAAPPSASGRISALEPFITATHTILAQVK